MFGLFTRLTDPDAAEALAASALDFLVLDVEHGGLDRADISRIAATARASDLPLIVRMPGFVQPDIHHAIAVGATGIIVPHVTSGEEAKAIVDFARGPGLQRAYAGMGRVADFRRAGWEAFEHAMYEQFVVIAQVDDAAGAHAAADIAATEGLDAVFAGSLSLALSCKVPATGAAIDQVISGICDACVGAHCRVGMHIVDPSERDAWTARGVNLFVIGNDLNLLRQGADRLVAPLRAGL